MLTNPVVKRMLRADDESLTTGATLNNSNLFSYCDNNPVNRADDSGEFWHIVACAAVGATLSVATVLKVSADYTSQRCPKCGRIHKSNRKHDTHEYTCDCCGYRSNDDRVGAMNIYTLGTMYVSGDENPRFGKQKNITK